MEVQTAEAAAGAAQDPESISTGEYLNEHKHRDISFIKECNIADLSALKTLVCSLVCKFQTWRGSCVISPRCSTLEFCTAHRDRRRHRDKSKSENVSLTCKSLLNSTNSDTHRAVGYLVTQKAVVDQNMSTDRIRPGVESRPGNSDREKPQPKQESNTFRQSVVEGKEDFILDSSDPEVKIATHLVPGGSAGQTIGAKSLQNTDIPTNNPSPPPASTESITMTGEEFLWADKYRPKSLEDFICNRKQALYLRRLVSQRRCPHLIFQGLPGVGKRTLALAMLHEIFGGNEQEVKHERRVFELKGEGTSEIIVPITSSSCHVEINLGTLGGYERHVIMTLVKEMHKAVKKRSPDADDDHSQSTQDYKVLVVHEAGRLSADAQRYVRWLMDRYQETCKTIFCCCNASKLVHIRSRCHVIEFDLPTNEQLIEVLQHIAKQEGIDLPEPFAKRIADSSHRNLCQAIRSLEACCISKFHFTENQKIPTGWEDDIADIAKCIVDEQSPKQLYNIRSKLYKLIMHNVPPDYIFTRLVEELKRHLDDNLQRKVEELYGVYTGKKRLSDSDGESSITNGGKDATEYQYGPSKENAKLFVKIEEFTARFMSLYKAAKARNMNMAVSIESTVARKITSRLNCIATAI